MLENLAPHISLHMYAYAMAIILDKVVHTCFQNENADKRCAPDEQQAQILLRNVHIHNVSGNHWKKQVASRRNKRAKHIQ